jgi:hypothetical protein
VDSGESGSEESEDDYEELSSGNSSDENSEETSDDDDALVAKDGTRWRRQLSDTPSRRGPARAENVFRQTSGPSLKAKRDIHNEETAMSALSLIVNEQMLRKIQGYTIAEAELRTGNKWILSLEELESFIGLLYARGIMGAKNIPLHELWTEKWGNNIFRKTMARERFKEILRYIRFDEKTSRSERLEKDKFALFLEIWNLFNENCRRHYTPTENLTVDEQLFPTKARCRFTQFMPNKPDKFGIKIWTLAEVDSKYFLHGIPYLGKDELRTGHTLAHHVVFQLVDAYLDNGYHITADNFFTQLPLAVSLKERKTTYLGTMRVNRREIPKEALVLSGKPLYNSQFFIEENGALLTSYKGKKNKIILILSTRHEMGTVSQQQKKKKPNTVVFYNDTKYGVDCLDQMCKAFSVKAKVRRWPLALFFNLLDLAAINAWILYKQTTGRPISRRAFIQQLVDDLVSVTKKSERTPVIPLALHASQSEKRRQCSQCRNKTYDMCFFCSKPVCGKCIVEKRVQNRCPDCLQG